MVAGRHEIRGPDDAHAGRGDRRPGFVTRMQCVVRNYAEGLPVAVAISSPFTLIRTRGRSVR